MRAPRADAGADDERLPLAPELDVRRPLTEREALALLAAVWAVLVAALLAVCAWLT